MKNKESVDQTEEDSSKITPYRKFVIQGLERVENGELASIVLKDAPPNNYALCQEMLYGCLRWQGSLDKMIAANAKRRPKKSVRRILRMALYELYFMKKLRHAVIDQAVELCKTSKNHRAHKFVNAFLRQAQFPLEVYANENFPSWLMELWSQAGPWLKSLQSPPRVAMSFKSDKAMQQYNDVFESDCTVDGESVSKMMYSNQSGPIRKWKGYEEGDWWIMNPAAATVVDKTMEQISLLNPSLTNPSVLDVCAAPGGKSFRFHSLGATVTAMDLDSKRLGRFEENCNRLGISLTTHVQDSLMHNPALGTFDVVFLDAPCSGLGVIRKHPEIRWNRTLADIQASKILQISLLYTASKYVNENGILAFCVCSLHPLEGIEVVRDFLKGSQQKYNCEGGEINQNLHNQWELISEWSTPIQKKQIMVEKLDGFQLFILRRKGQKNSEEGDRE